MKGMYFFKYFILDLLRGLGWAVRRWIQFFEVVLNVAFQLFCRIGPEALY